MNEYVIVFSNMKQIQKYKIDVFQINISSTVFILKSSFVGVAASTIRIYHLLK